MKIISYQSDAGPRIAGLLGDDAIDLNDADSNLPACSKVFLARASELVGRAEKAMASGRPLEKSIWSGGRRLPPVAKPEKIVCIGLNYADHARETGAATPSCPVLFNKFPTALTAHEGPIVLPRVSRQVDFEAELVVIIGRGGKCIPVSRAREHIAGYACGNDVSARDWQLGKPGGQWLAGKSFDTFAPCGPWINTSDEIPDPSKLGIQLRLNGELMQNSNTAQMIFPFDELVSYISEVCTLKPGDLIYTGTPPGVGVARKPQVFLKSGDVVEVEIERLGILRNRVVAQEECESEADR